MRNDTPAMRALEPDMRRRWYQALRGTGQYWVVGDRDAESLAYFQISRSNGELLAVLPDGSGGGYDAVQNMIKSVDNLKTVMDLYEAATWMPGEVPGLGAVAHWGQVLARLYAAVTVTIMVLGTTGQDEQAQKVIKRLACQAADMVAKGPLGGTGLTEHVGVLVAVLVGAENGCG